MGTTASILLQAMAVRLKCQRDGTTDPSQEVKAATEALVRELSLLGEDDPIEVTIYGCLITYKHVPTDRILASFESDSFDVQ